MPGLAARSPSRLASVFDERSDLPAERCGVLLARVDLVLGAAQPEPHRLIRRTAIKIVFQCDGNLLCHSRLLDCDRLPAPYKINRQVTVTATPLRACHLQGTYRVATWCRRQALICSMATESFGVLQATWHVGHR